MLDMRRTWFYFRIGHGSYLGFLIGLTEFLTVQYVLVIQRIGFPIHFTLFILIFAIVYGVGCTLLGYGHKRFQLKTETDISTIANPYTYKVTPGKEQKVLLPLALFNMKLSLLLVEKMKFLTPEVRSEYDQMANILNRLIAGEEIR